MKSPDLGNKLEHHHPFLPAAKKGPSMWVSVGPWVFLSTAEQVCLFQATRSPPKAGSVGWPSQSGTGLLH